MSVGICAIFGAVRMPATTSSPWALVRYSPNSPFTRDPNTGEKALLGEYLTNAQGEDVVAGIRTAPKISQMQTDMPEVYGEFVRIGEQLEKHYRDVQDLEFTIERGKLYMLQTRSAKRTAAAAVKIATD